MTFSGSDTYGYTFLSYKSHSHGLNNILTFQLPRAYQSLTQQTTAQLWLLESRKGAFKSKNMLQRFMVERPPKHVL